MFKFHPINFNVQRITKCKSELNLIKYSSGYIKSFESRILIFKAGKILDSDEEKMTLYFKFTYILVQKLIKT